MFGHHIVPEKEVVGNRDFRINTLIIIGSLATLLLFWGLCENAFTQTKKNEKSHDEDQQKIGVLIQNGDWKTAKAIAEVWAKDDPAAAVALFVEDVAGFMTKTRKHPSRSISDFPYSDKDVCDQLLSWIQDLMVAEPKNSNYLMLNGAFYARGRRDFERALEYFEKVVDVEPDNSIVLSLMGAGYGAKNRLDDAVRVSERAIKLDPDCAQAYNNLGLIQTIRGNNDNAEKYFKKAVACSGAGEFECFNLGSFYLDNGRLQDAKTYLLKAVKLSPNFYIAHWNLASVYYRLGMRKDCILECKKVVKLVPNSVVGQKAKNNLGLMGE